jgi:hypothetical protein
MDAGVRWLLLIHQLPAKPAYARVKVWRRLQALGAVTVKGGLCAARNARDPRGLRLARQGDRRKRRRGVVCEAAPDRRAFRRELQGYSTVRDEDYARIAAKPRSSARSGGRRPSGCRCRGPAHTHACASSSTHVDIDFFGAEGAPDARDLLGERLKREGRKRTTAERTRHRHRADGSLWVTRKGRADRPHRLGLADPPLHRSRARFKFVPGDGYSRNRASCASTCSRASSRTRATAAPSRCCWPSGLATRRSAIGEIIHDIDLKDGKYGREETPASQPDRGIAARQRRRRAAAGARRRGARRPLQLVRGQGEAAEGPRRSFGEAMKVWARVAALSFGGPAGQIAVMHRIIVEEKKWIGDQRFLQALNYCTLLPRPEAQAVGGLHRLADVTRPRVAWSPARCSCCRASGLDHGAQLDLRAARQGHSGAGPVSSGSRPPCW